MRLLNGSSGWWCIGESKVALLPHRAVTADRQVSAGGLAALERHGVLQPAAGVSNIYYLTVLTTTGCNLGCGYCFQNASLFKQDTFNPRRIRLSVLDDDVIDQTLEFTGRMMREAGCDQLHVMLFGGEPLLNIDGCMALLTRAQAYKLRDAAMITNGVLLTPAVARRLFALGLSTVQITLDGDRTTHDRIRTTRDGHATFDTIIRNLVAMCETTCLGITLRVNVSDQNATGIPGMLRELAAMVPVERCAVTFSLVEDVGVGYENSMHYDRPSAARFIEWYLLALQMGFQVPRPRDGFGCFYCTEQRGARGAVVNSDGTLASCWETAGKPGYIVGHVCSGYLPDRDLVDQRWVNCGYADRSTSSKAEQREFKNQVDAAVLDWLYEHGQLSHAQSMVG